MDRAVPVSADSGKGVSYVFPLSMLTALFFMWGFITCLNDILIPHLRNAFDLTYGQVALVQSAFFLAYFVASLPAGALVNRIGFQRGIVVGLCMTAAGAGLFVPAASLVSFPVFLVALFVLASGITVLQVAANPYVTLLGSARYASARLNLTQAFNSLGTTIAPALGSILVLGAAVNATNAADKAAVVKGPYIGLALTLLVIAVVFSVLRLPKPENASIETPEPRMWLKALRVPQTFFGAIGIFVYVGGEVAIGSFLVNYIAQPTVLGLSVHDAAFYVSYYWGGAMIGRFVGSFAQRYIRPGIMLACAAGIVFCLVAGAVAIGGPVSLWMLLSVGLFNSIMFPTIFSLGVRKLGGLTSIASSVMIMAIVGGAIIPLGVGILADWTALRWAFAVPACCYLYIAWYGWYSRD